MLMKKLHSTKQGAWLWKSGLVTIEIKIHMQLIFLLFIFYSVHQILNTLKTQ